MEYHRAVVLANGAPVAGPILLPDDALIIAADGGLAVADNLDLSVDLVIGDMDSVDRADLERAEHGGAAVERHPVDKAATDLALAIDAAVARGARDITIVGGSGGRLDHLLANTMLLVADRYSDLAMTWLTGAEQVVPVRDGRPLRLEGRPGDLVSLIPAGGPALGVTTSGLRWRLEGEDLPLGSPRGISNAMTGTEAGVTIDAGTLLVVHQAGN